MQELFEPQVPTPEQATENNQFDLSMFLHNERKWQPSEIMVSGELHKLRSAYHIIPLPHMELDSIDQ